MSVMAGVSAFVLVAVVVLMMASLLMASLLAVVVVVTRRLAVSALLLATRAVSRLLVEVSATLIESVESQSVNYAFSTKGG